MASITDQLLLCIKCRHISKMQNAAYILICLDSKLGHFIFFFPSVGLSWVADLLMHVLRTRKGREPMLCKVHFAVIYSFSLCCWCSALPRKV